MGGGRVQWRSVPSPFVRRNHAVGPIYDAPGKRVRRWTPSSAALMAAVSEAERNAWKHASALALKSIVHRKL
jgi:hypothetical protein